MNFLKVLIITYYFPPAGGAGVQRWLKFIKYFRSFGVEPIIYTVKNAKYPILDKSLCAEIPKDILILKENIFEPASFFKFFGKHKMQSAGFLKNEKKIIAKIVNYIRANYFIPDAKKCWINPSVKYLSAFLKSHPVDYIISTGPPHTTHVIAQKLKEKLGIKWLADFRDPWTKIDYFHHLPLTKKAFKKHIFLEKKVLKNADKITVVGKTMQKDYKKYNPKTFILPNGFDFESKKSEKLDAFFSITYVGAMNEDRNPKVLWKILKDFCKNNKNFKKHLQLKFVGNVDSEIIKNLKQDFGLSENLIFKGYFPHNQVLKYQKNSQILLLCVNKVPNNQGIITGKIFEYLAAQRPILAMGPENGDVSDILKNTTSGKIFDYENEKDLKEKLKQYYEKFLSKNLQVNSQNIAQYHRKNLTKKLVEILQK